MTSGNPNEIRAREDGSEELRHYSNKVSCGVRDERTHASRSPPFPLPLHRLRASKGVICAAFPSFCSLLLKLLANNQKSRPTKAFSSIF